ncbi:hypothetical protein EDB83DRAFT_2326771 [Lactarius deliciosus]|nr:hypothetical protein EDB83DRAFT_2326771 [Lactarius deliciosus]
MSRTDKLIRNIATELRYANAKRSGFGLAPFTGRNCYQPIYSRIASAGGETNWLQFAVPGGLIDGGTKIDPTLYRTDRLARQMFTAVGKLPQISPLVRLLGESEDKKQASVSKLVRGELLLTSARRRPAATHRGLGGPSEDLSDVARVDGNRGEGLLLPRAFTFLRSCWAVQFRELGKCAQRGLY